jgi:hypothetical protein
MATCGAANWDRFDMTTVALNYPAPYMCPGADAAMAFVGVATDLNYVYYTPDATNQNPVFVRFNPFRSAGSPHTGLECGQLCCVSRTQCGHIAAWPNVSQVRPGF